MEKETKKETFGGKFKKALDAKMIGLILLAGVFVGEKVWATYTTGADLEFQHKVEAIYDNLAFEKKVNELFQSNMGNPAILNQILGSPQVANFAEEGALRVERTIVERVLRDDSSKISTVGFIGAESGMRDEEVLPILAKLAKAWKHGEFITKEEFERLTGRTITATF